MRRKNGLQWPLDPHQVSTFEFAVIRGRSVRSLLTLQVASFIVFGFLVSGCYAFYVPFVPAPARYVLAALYAVIVCIVLSLAYLTRWVATSTMTKRPHTATDPMHDVTDSACDPSDPGLQGGNEGEYYCALCTVG